MKRVTLALCAAAVGVALCAAGQEPPELTVPPVSPMALPVTLASQPVETTGARGAPGVDDALDHTTVSVAAGVPFGQAVAAIADATKCTIVVDWSSVQGMGIDKNTPTNTALNKVPARMALRTILSQFGDDAQLLFVADHGQILIATRENLQRRFQAVRVYDVGFWLSDYEPGSQDEQDAEASLLDTIKASVEPDSWRDAGGEIGVARMLDGKMIVNQSYDVLPKLDAFIDLLRKNPARSTTAYDVRDLLKDAPPPDALGHGKLEDLINTIETTCGRDTWRDKGGKTSSIAPFGGKLYVTTTPAVQEQIAGLLAMMRK